MKIYNSAEKEKEIISVEEWLNFAPPQGKEKQWKDTRSAKEMAKFWVDNDNQEKFKAFIRQGIPDFDYGYAIPEYKSKFDEYGRNMRKHDLFILSKDNNTVITIEGKADESFGSRLFVDELDNGITVKSEKPTSKIIDRMIGLYSKTFHNNDEILDIMYQLTYWFAGSIQDAIRHNSENVMMILFEFQSCTTTEENLKKNHEDFENFIKFISEDRFTEISNEQILGPVKNQYTENKNLYIGYYSINLEK
jgi:hypothetical protein